MIVGFTGSRFGMTDAQRDKFKLLVIKLNPKEFHHGDCLGADQDAHWLVNYHGTGIKITIHPPENSSLRAWCLGDMTLPPLPYLVRNRAIVNACRVLVACPDGGERRRSGTWSTIRYGRGRKGVRVVVINGDGGLDR